MMPPTGEAALSTGFESPALYIPFGPMASAKNTNLYTGRRLRAVRHLISQVSYVAGCDGVVVSEAVALSPTGAPHDAQNLSPSRSAFPQVVQWFAMCRTFLAA
jgi:hypothetical protein